MYFTQQCCLTPFLNNALNQRSQQKHPGTWCILKQEKRGQTCKSCKHAFERSRFQNQEINNEISGLFLLLKAIVYTIVNSRRKLKTRKNKGKNGLLSFKYGKKML